MRLRIAKWILWFFTGAMAVVALFRFMHGLGPSTNLTDMTPWGFWIGFDVMGGVALAAGGFIMAGTVYVLRLERYRPFLRPAVLTAFLGYILVAVGLLFDLGVPYNIVRPVFHWQHHSALFEVAWCVILYLNVLALEFLPVVVEKTPFHKVLNLLKKGTVFFVILGIMLSSLHQSSLGTLMVLMPARVHTLWYSPILPVLFLVSAVSLGLMMIVFESLVTGYLYEHKTDTKLLGGLGHVASYVLLVYLTLRCGDLAYRGQLSRVLDGTWESALFVFEISLSALLPMLLLMTPKIRQSKAGLFAAAAMVVVGLVLYRIDASGISHLRATQTFYVPSISEFIVSIGLVSGAALVFFFFIDYFDVFAPGAHECLEDQACYDSKRQKWLREVDLAASVKRYSVPFTVAAALTFALLPEQSIFGAEPLETETQSPRGSSDAMIIDGDRARFAVTFNHDEHAEREGGEGSCTTCHHMNSRLKTSTPCVECHRDVYMETDIFDHELHVAKRVGDHGCESCHERGEPPSLGSSKSCGDCHSDLRAERTSVKLSPTTRENIAVSYKDAMHGLCIDCHLSRAAEVGRPNLAICTTCHPPIPGEQMSPAVDIVLETAAIDPSATNTNANAGDH